MSLTYKSLILHLKFGEYFVTYMYTEGTLDNQISINKDSNLELISLAQHGFLRATQQEGETRFNVYTRTNADVFYDDRSGGRVVIDPTGSISKKLVGIANLVNAHMQDKEYVIPEDQRKTVYSMVDRLLKNGTAFIVPHGATQVNTSELGTNDLTSKLFSDKELGIKAQNYGNWLLGQNHDKIWLWMDDKNYSLAQSVPYLSKLRSGNSEDNFTVYGVGKDLHIPSGGGALGVRFEKSAKVARKSRIN